MSKKRFVGLLAPVVALGLATTACSAAGSSGGGGGNDRPVTGLQILVPNSPGSGYDLTARAAAKAMEQARLARNVEVANLAGAGGTIALARLVNEKGNGDLLMQMGLGVVGASYTNKTKATLQDTTPVAKLIEEPETVIVKADSPYQTLQDLVEEWKANPKGTPVGGGSVPGGPDHLAPHLLAKAIGIDPKQVNYVAYDGGGELLTAILGDRVRFGMSGPGEFADQIEAGQVRVLGVSTAERIEGVAAPTFKEAGVELEFSNWRGFVAPPGISAEDKQKLTDLADDMHSSQEWKDAVEQHNFTDAYASGDEFATFLQSENDRVAGVLKELGLTA